MSDGIKFVAIVALTIVSIVVIIHFAPDRRVVLTDQEMSKQLESCRALPEDWQFRQSQCIKQIQDNFRTEK